VENLPGEYKGDRDQRKSCITAMKVFFLPGKNIPALRLAALCLFLGCYCASAQLVTSDKNQLPRNYLIRVKQFSEFIARFNYEKDFLNQDIGPAFSDKISRGQYIGLLFNSTSDSRMPEKTIHDTLVANFIREVCRDSLFIDDYSELVFAELKCRVTINGKNSYVSVLARQEVDHGLKWSFVSVHPDFNGDGGNGNEAGQYMTPGTQKEQPDYIPPLSNETNFIVLKKILTGKNNLGIYTAKHHNPERINDFYRAIGTGELKFNYVEAITYYLFDVPGWIIVIRNYQRDTANSGWLISELMRIEGDSYPYFTDKFGLSRFR
jgi:hypothetical protein